MGSSVISTVGGASGMREMRQRPSSLCAVHHLDECGPRDERLGLEDAVCVLHLWCEARDLRRLGPGVAQFVERQHRRLGARDAQGERGLLGHQDVRIGLEPFRHGGAGQQNGRLARIGRRLQPGIHHQRNGRLPAWRRQSCRPGCCAGRPVRAEGLPHSASATGTRKARGSMSRQEDCGAPAFRESRPRSWRTLCSSQIACCSGSSESGESRSAWAETGRWAKPGLFLDAAHRLVAAGPRACGSAASATTGTQAQISQTAPASATAAEGEARPLPPGPRRPWR